MFIEDITSLLIAGGAGTAFGIDIFAGPKSKLPEVDTAFISIQTTGGLIAEKIHNEIQPPAFRRPAAQIMARAKEYEDARTLILLAYAALNIRNQTVNSTYYREIEPQQEPFDLSLDSRGRVRLAFNVMGSSS